MAAPAKKKEKAPAAQLMNMGIMRVAPQGVEMNVGSSLDRPETAAEATWWAKQDMTADYGTAMSYSASNLLSR